MRTETMRQIGYVVPYPEKRETFEAFVFERVGGYTKLMGSGAWRDPETLDVFEEPVATYLVAAETDVLHSITVFFLALLREEGELAAYYYDAGVASVVTF